VHCDQSNSLEPDDLERLATCACLVGRDADMLRAFERAHHAYLERALDARAARCAFWLGFHLLLKGETGPSTGWLARARRLLEVGQQDHAEQGYLMIAAAELQLDAGASVSAYDSAQSALAIGQRFRDADLVAIALHLQGRARLQQHELEHGLGLFDEAMVAVTTGELSPVVTGLLYCSVIDACQRVFELGRARDWTAALSRWCDDQPEMVAFSGACRVHRAEIMQLRGAWTEALLEAERAFERCREQSPRTAGAALYQQAELHRLRGEPERAEAAYRAASQAGCEPQPGLSLLRVAQGRASAGAAAVRRIEAATVGRWQRARLLPAYVEIMLAAGHVDDARRACDELGALATDLDRSVLTALAHEARGAVALAEREPRVSLDALARALQTYRQIDAPYLAARVRVLIGRACLILDDHDGAKLELDAARSAFEQLGAASELAALDQRTRLGAQPGHRLSERELQVLRLVAVGKTNRAIATELGLSEKTIERHVSNIFGKLCVASRTAATAFAYEHELL
jgi:DNA-binding NarL/FixJ family response regulator